MPSGERPALEDAVNVRAWHLGEVVGLDLAVDRMLFRLHCQPSVGSAWQGHPCP